MMKRRIIALVLCLVLVFVTGTLTVSAEDAAENTISAEYEYEVLEDGSIKLTKYNGQEEKLSIPDTVDGLTVTEIGDSCFAGNIFIKKVYVPEGIAKIGAYAFECASVLSKIYLPDSLISIGEGAFSGCGYLTLVDMQNNVESIGKGAFLYCTSLKIFEAPEALTSIGAFAFGGCSGLLSADLSASGLTELPDRLFYACDRLRLSRIPNSLETIGVRTYSNCPELKEIYFPNTLLSIGAYAFSGCSALTNISIPCENIEPFTFADCNMLQYVNFSENLKSIASGAFRNDSVIMEYLEIPEGAKVAEDAFGPVTGDDESYAGYTEETEAAEAEVPAEFREASEILADAESAGLRLVSRDEFEGWAEEYIEANTGNALFTREENPYITMYKDQIPGYYRAMTAVANNDADNAEKAVIRFGEGYEEMFAMVNHGLKTEISRFNMAEDMLLSTGVYDSQLMAAAGTDHVPSLDELKACVGKTFTDNCLTSTTTELDVAYGFSDTLFIIYAPAENINALGAVCMDSYMHTVENEILLNSGAAYEIMEVGTLHDTVTDEFDGTVSEVYKDYILLKLISE